jgi:hypothetical protein
MGNRNSFASQGPDDVLPHCELDALTGLVAILGITESMGLLIV